MSTLCDSRDGSPPGSPVPGILQARTLEWVAIPFSSAWKSKVKVKSLSRVRLLVTPWTAAYQAPPSMGFSRQEYWSGVPLPSPMVPSLAHLKSIIPFSYVFLLCVWWGGVGLRGGKVFQNHYLGSNQGESSHSLRVKFLKVWLPSTISWPIWIFLLRKKISQQVFGEHFCFNLMKIKVMFPMNVFIFNFEWHTFISEILKLN